MRCGAVRRIEAACLRALREVWGWVGLIGGADQADVIFTSPWS